MKKIPYQITSVTQLIHCKHQLLLQLNTVATGAMCRQHHVLQSCIANGLETALAPTTMSHLFLIAYRSCSLLMFLQGESITVTVNGVLCVGLFVVVIIMMATKSFAMLSLALQGVLLMVECFNLQLVSLSSAILQLSPSEGAQAASNLVHLLCKTSLLCFKGCCASLLVLLRGTCAWGVTAQRSLIQSV